MTEPLDVDEVEELTPRQLAALVRRDRFAQPANAPDDDTDDPRALIRQVPRRHYR